MALPLLSFEVFQPHFAEWRRCCSLFAICEASDASIHKLAKAQGCFEGSRQCILSFEKISPSKIPNETVWPRQLLPTNMTNIILPLIHNYKTISSLCEPSENKPGKTSSFQRVSAFTNWQKPKAVLKGPDNIFCHMRKLLPQTF